MTNDHAGWRRSSYSGAGGGSTNDCVEPNSDLFAVRDSKNPAGGTLRGDLPALLAAIKVGQFD